MRICNGGREWKWSRHAVLAHGVHDMKATAINRCSKDYIAGRGCEHDWIVGYALPSPMSQSAQVQTKPDHYPPTGVVACSLCFRAGLFLFPTRRALIGPRLPLWGGSVRPTAKARSAASAVFRDRAAASCASASRSAASATVARYPSSARSRAASASAASVRAAAAARSNVSARTSADASSRSRLNTRKLTYGGRALDSEAKRNHNSSSSVRRGARL
jgi:hypothetical protein